VEGEGVGGGRYGSEECKGCKNAAGHFFKTISRAYVSKVAARWYRGVQCVTKRDHRAQGLPAESRYAVTVSAPERNRA